MAYRPIDFWTIGGYDESLGPSGGQDVQLKMRLGWYILASGGTDHVCKVKNYQIVGGCFPNDFANTAMKHDRALAKTVNIDPVLLAKFKGPEEKMAQDEPRELAEAHQTYRQDAGVCR
jgi:hypothetical protein